MDCHFPVLIVVNCISCREYNPLALSLKTANFPFLWWGKFVRKNTPWINILFITFTLPLNGSIFIDMNRQKEVFLSLKDNPTTFWILRWNKNIFEIVLDYVRPYMKIQIHLVCGTLTCTRILQKLEICGPDVFTHYDLWISSTLVSVKLTQKKGIKIR